MDEGDGRSAVSGFGLSRPESSDGAIRTPHSCGEPGAKQEAETQARLEQALESIANSTLDAFRQGAAEASHQFASELKHYSRSHLEFVSGAISEVAKGLGKLSKE